MSEASDLLGLDFENLRLNNKGDSLMYKLIRKKLDVQIGILKDIAQKEERNSIIEPKHEGIIDSVRRFNRIAKLGTLSSEVFSPREIDNLCFGLTLKVDKQYAIIEDSEKLKLFLQLADETWKDRYIFGLLKTLLDNWNNESNVELGRFLSPKIENLTSNTKRYSSLQALSRYFKNSNGDILLGSDIALNDKQIKIDEITSYLGFNDSWISAKFFVGVIQAYITKSGVKLEGRLRSIERFLVKHNNGISHTDSSKLVISKIINACENSSEKIQDQVKDMALLLVGDPKEPNAWRYPKYCADNDERGIDSAVGLLNAWITRQFINVFFEKCINDERRKKFWLRYSKEIITFKVFGSRQVKNLLKHDQRIAEFVNNRYGIVESTKNVSAFMFSMSNYKMIEFSDPGYAFIAYKNDSQRAPSFDSKYLQSIETFRNGALPFLVRNDGRRFFDYKLEGRLTHADTTYNWEQKFQNWLSKVPGINV